MKTGFLPPGLLAVVGALALASCAVRAQTTADSARAAAPAKLPYGVDDVLKLSRARVSEDVILNYIKSTGTIYTMTPSEIVYLKSQGVSDAVVNAMVDQKKNVEAAAPAAPEDPAPGPTVAYANPADVAPTYTDWPETTYVEPASSVYVIPYPAASYAYYGSSVSVGIGFGSYAGWGNYPYYGHRGWWGYPAYCAPYHGGYHGGYYGCHRPPPRRPVPYSGGHAAGYRAATYSQPTAVGRRPPGSTGSAAAYRRPASMQSRPGPLPSPPAPQRAAPASRPR